MPNPPSTLPPGIAPRPELPYDAVIFTSRRNSHDAAGYGEMAEWMITLAAQQLGYLGMESARDADGLGTPSRTGRRWTTSPPGDTMPNTCWHADRAAPTGMTPMPFASDGWSARRAGSAMTARLIRWPTHKAPLAADSSP